MNQLNEYQLNEFPVFNDRILLGGGGVWLAWRGVACPLQEVNFHYKESKQCWQLSVGRSLVFTLLVPMESISWCHLVCPGCPHFGESVYRGPTVYKTQYPDIPCVSAWKAILPLRLTIVVWCG